MRSRVFGIRIYVIAAIAMFMIIVLIATVEWWRMRAHGKNAVMAIVTVHELSPGDYGTVRMRYHIAIKGSPIVFRLGKRSANSVFVYEELRQVTSISDLIFGSSIGPDGEGEGSYELGKSSRLEMLDAPRRIELKPGESYTLATCIKANGERVELFVSCE